MAARAPVAVRRRVGDVPRRRDHHASRNAVVGDRGYGAATTPRQSAHTCTGDGWAMVLRAGLPLKDMDSCSSTHCTTGGRAHHRGRAGEAATTNSKAARHGALCAERQGPGDRDVVSRRWRGNPRGEGGGAREGPNLLHLTTSTHRAAQRLQASRERQIFPVDLTDTDAGGDDGPTTMAAPCNYHAR